LAVDKFGEADIHTFSEGAMLGEYATILFNGVAIGLADSGNDMGVTHGYRGDFKVAISAFERVHRRFVAIQLELRGLE
jgi:hypothetical protein